MVVYSVLCVTKENVSDSIEFDLVLHYLLCSSCIIRSSSTKASYALCYST